MKLRYKNLAVGCFLAFIFAGIGLIRLFDTVDEYEAFVYLLEEIREQLSEIPEGADYPESLTDLTLTFPGGGDPSLLSQFQYESTGTSCRLVSEFRNERFVDEFP